jgi:hypothetical protein
MDTNRIIKIEELEIGDEIIVSSNGHLRYYKVCRLPKKSAKSSKWSGVKCSTKMDREERVLYQGTSYMRTKVFYRYYCTPEEHNTEKMIYGLNYKDMWLVKREGM